MERLTTQYSDLLKEVVKELSLLDTPASDKCIVNYSEIPCFPGGQFSLFLVRGESNKLGLIRKSWDSEYDCKRFSSGIYNLDRLCIKTSSVELSQKERNEYEEIISNIKSVPEKLENESYIILDGIDYKLTIKTNRIHKDYSWKIPTNNIQLFTPLIDFLTTKTGD